MIDHAHSHHAAAYQKIAVVKGTDPPIFRPEQHYFNTATEQYQLQGDSELYDVIIPDIAKLGSDSIKCRKCDHKIQIISIDGDRLPIKTLARKVVEMRRHELACKFKIIN